MKNSESGRSRGFGFVTFSDPANVSLVLQNGPHQLDGRTIDPKPCNPRSLQKPKRSNSFPKVFLGGLPSNVTETDLRTYFTRFGKVMEVVIMYDQEKKKSRGFGFLSFELDEAVDRCVAEHFVNLNGKQVEIKKAEPRDSNKMGDGLPNWGPPQGGPPMGMGGPHSGLPLRPLISKHPKDNTKRTTIREVPFSYGTPSGPGGYQGWGAPPGPQGQQMPPSQWGSNYGGPPQQQGYGSYAKDSYVVPDRGLQIHNGTLDPDDLAPLKHATITDQEYNKMQGSSVLPSSRRKKLVNVPPSDAGQGDGAGAATYTAGPGPQRGGNYSQPTATPSFHPYRRM
uniref:RRM domain-containing protein n=1 Tax=Timema genevievae TaxID=629358 RepID=A0A7R9PJD9_TIMGE|nr:unnamed protein product [Timema genevievae]